MFLCIFYLMRVFMFFFFFQAEDGIRDHCVTGVQTCALPISSRLPAFKARPLRLRGRPKACGGDARRSFTQPATWFGTCSPAPFSPGDWDREIGRASCRERV